MPLLVVLSYGISPRCDIFDHIKAIWIFCPAARPCVWYCIKYTLYLILFLLVPPSLVLSHISFAALNPPLLCPSHVPHSIFLLCKFYCYISKGHPFVCMPARVLGSLHSRLQCSCLLFVLPDLPTLCNHKSLVYLSFRVFFCLNLLLLFYFGALFLDGCVKCRLAKMLAASFCLDWSFGIIAKKKKMEWPSGLSS